MNFIVRSIGIVLIFSGAVACGGQSPQLSDASTQSQAIVGGVASEYYESVGALGVVSELGFTTLCTATLVAPTKVLTSASCLEFDGANIQPWMLSFCTGSDVRDGSNCYDVVHYSPHPDFSSLLLTNDIALVELRFPGLPGLTPSALRTDFLADGPEFPSTNWVGYGVSDLVAQDAGIKRVAYGTITDLLTGSFLVEYDASGPCLGDLGAPALTLNAIATYEVAGVVSAFTADDSGLLCAGHSIHTSVAYHADWLNTQLALPAFSGCTLLAGDCEAGETCVWINHVGVCQTAGATAVGEACNPDPAMWASTLPCEDGATCLALDPTDFTQGTCYLYCEGDQACSGDDVCNELVSGDVICTAADICIDMDADGFCKEDDCNDADASLNPDATEICDDYKDNDCDGDTDAADADCVVPDDEDPVDDTPDDTGDDDSTKSDSDDDGGCAALPGQGHFEFLFLVGLLFGFRRFRK